MAFEHPFPLTISGDVTTVVIVDPELPPSNILQRDDAWKIKVSWFVNGPATFFLGGDWHVKAYLESIGVGFEGQVGATINVPLSAGTFVGPDRLDYSTTIDVAAANSLGINAGPYKLVTTVTYTNIFGKPREMAGFVEGPLLQFYDPA